MHSSPELAQIEAAFAELPPLLTDIKLFVAVFVLETIVLILLSCVSSTLILFFCITFGAVIAKKAKVFAAIGLYYVINGAITSIIQVGSMFILPSISSYMANVQENLQQAVVLLVFLVVVIAFFVICALLYTLEYWLIDRKLNLC